MAAEDLDALAELIKQALTDIEEDNLVYDLQLSIGSEILNWWTQDEVDNLSSFVDVEIMGAIDDLDDSDSDWVLQVWVDGELIHSWGPGTHKVN